MRFFFAGILLLALLASQAAAAQPTEKDTYRYSLDQCIQYAVEHQINNDLARLNVRDADQNVREYLSTGLPQVNGQVDVRDNVVIPTQVIPAEAFGGPPGEFIDVQFGIRYNSTIGANLSQLLFDGSFFLGLKAAKEYKKLTKIQLQQTEIETAANVSKAYYAVLVNRRRVDLLQSSLTQLETLLDNTEALYENGFAEKVDVTRIRVNLNNTQTEMDKVRRLVKISEDLLKFQMGMPLEYNLVLTDKIDENDVRPVAADTLMEYDAQSRIEYQLLQQNLHLQDLNVRATRYRYLPTANLYAAYQYQAFREKFNFLNFNEEWFGASYIGVQVNVPIFDGFRKDAALQRAYIERQKVQRQLDNLALNVNMEYRQARAQLVNNIRTVEAQQRNIELAQEVYDVTKIKYEEGVGTNFEVVQADTELKNARTNYVNALLEAYLSRIDLLKASGKLYEPNSAAAGK